MRTLKPLLLSAVLIGVCAIAHAATPHATPQAATVAAAKSAPVRCCGKCRIPTTASICSVPSISHAGRLPLSPDIDAAFDDAESLFFEIDPAAMTAPETITKFQAAAASDDGRTLSQVLPEATRGKLEKLLAKSGGSIAAFDASEPWAVNLGLVLGLTQAMGFRAEEGLDRHFMARAEKAGKPAGGLEDVDVQLAALDGAPHAEQIAGLDEFLSDPVSAVTEMRSLHAAWRQGDLRTLDRKFRVEMAQKTPVSYKLVNRDRNNAWMATLEQRLKGSTSDDTLAVVGTLHLLGDDGVVEQLRARGYKVERMCSGCARKKN